MGLTIILEGSIFIVFGWICDWLLESKGFFMKIIF